MSMFILKAAFMSVPKSLDEAAELEARGSSGVSGASTFPLTKSGLSTAGILMFPGELERIFLCVPVDVQR